jgi:hypothetical protein
MVALHDNCSLAASSFSNPNPSRCASLDNSQRSAFFVWVFVLYPHFRRQGWYLTKRFKSKLCRHLTRPTRESRDFLFRETSKSTRNSCILKTLHKKVPLVGTHLTQTHTAKLGPRS